MIDKIRNEAQYQQIMGLIEKYIEKAAEQGGFHALQKAETKELERLSLLAEQYEDNVLKIMPLPVATISSVVQQKTKEMRLSQHKLAELFGMSTSKISQILNGKRPPDVPFLKAAHEKLGIDGNLILEQA